MINITAKTLVVFGLLVSLSSAIYAQGPALEITPQGIGWVAEFEEPKPSLIEICMQTLEEGDVFITEYDLKKGTVVTEYKNVTLEDAESYVSISLQEADFDIYRYRIELAITPVDEGKSTVNAVAIVKGYGRPNKHTGARPGWYTLPSNGTLEEEVLTSIDANVR